MSDFKEVLEQLRQYCQALSKIEGGVGVVAAGIGGGILGSILTGPPGWAAGTLYAVAIYLATSFWENVENTIAHFASLIPT